MEIMALDIQQGTEVTVYADGEVQEEAIKALKAFFEANL